MVSGPDASASVTATSLAESTQGIKQAHGRAAHVESLVFFAGLVVVALCVLGGLYFLFRHASKHDKLTRRKPPLANWK
jgi:hypothetical protein